MPTIRNTTAEHTEGVTAPHVQNCPMAPLVDLFNATIAQLDAQNDLDPNDRLCERLGELKDVIISFPATSAAALLMQARFMREHVKGFEVEPDVKAMLLLGADYAELLASRPAMEARP
jgi:hypothetical protein